MTLVQSYISHKKNIPNKFMSMIEMMVVYLREDVLKATIGDKEHRDWAPLIYTIFFFTKTPVQQICISINIFYRIGKPTKGEPTKNGFMHIYYFHHNFSLTNHT